MGVDRVLIEPVEASRNFDVTQLREDPLFTLFVKPLTNRFQLDQGIPCLSFVVQPDSLIDVGK